MRESLKKAINENKTFSELREIIVKFKNDGGSQNEAYVILEDCSYPKKLKMKNLRLLESLRTFILHP